MNEHIQPEEISAYLDGEASNPGAVQRHLQTCAVCARVHMQLAKLSAHLGALSGPEVRQDFASRVLASIDAAAPSRRMAKAWWVRMAVPLAAAAGVLLALSAIGPARVDAPELTIVAEVTPRQPVIETPYAEAADTTWLFAKDADVQPEPVAESERVLMALADVRIFDRDSYRLEGDVDMQSALGRMNESTAETLVVLLSDYAKEKVPAAW